MSLYFETSYESLNKHGEELSGDKVEIIKNDKETIIVLSDGLGSGVKANILASLTSKIVISMLKEGADIVDVVETIASTLPVCSERLVAYSTFTILRISSDGDAYIVQYDNPDIVILRNGKPLHIEKTETLIAGKTIKESKLRLLPDDICVMFSDGVVHAGVGKLLNLGWQHANVVEYLERSYKKDISAYAVQKLLLSACDSLYMHTPGDDTTVAICKIRTPNIAHIMVGPPVERSDDEKAVHELLHADGKKIVCGGTTSQIVSRISGHALEVSLNYITPDVPPTAKIQGIDLVTEGVITLGKALEHIKHYQSGHVGRENALNYKKDGASLLAQMLIEQCTGASFIVGRALNPAHQNADLPINLNLKLRLVTEIARYLRMLDKEVTVKYI
ncbi:MAG: SpoIIE family protein phosphatase [Bacillota bacterium]